MFGLPGMVIKKVVLGAAVGAGALTLAFGTNAPSYVRTAFHKVRHTAQSSVPVQFEIDRARDEINGLEPAIRENIETIARAEVDVEHLDREIAQVRSNLEGEKAAILTLRDRLEKGDLKLTGHVRATEDEFKAELGRRLDHFKNVKEILKEKETTLKAKDKSLSAARLQLQNMAAQKKSLMTKIEGIEAKLRMIEATEAANEFSFDDSSLARAKSTVADLEKRVEVMARVAEKEGRYAESGLPLSLEPGRDVVKEVESEFGTAPTAPRAPKSL